MIGRNPGLPPFSGSSQTVVRQSPPNMDCVHGQQMGQSRRNGGRLFRLSREA